METWSESVLDGEFDLSMRLVTLLNPYFFPNMEETRIKVIQYVLKIILSSFTEH